MRPLGRKRAETSSTHRNGISPGRWAAGIGLLCLVLSASNLSGKEVDRLVVAVNGTVITEGDLQIARILNPLVLSGKMVDPISSETEIDSLIDLELIRQELLNFSLDYRDPGALDDRVKQMRDRIQENVDIVRLLEQLGLQDSELDSYLRFLVSIMDFVDYRFGPFANVSKTEIEAYYKDTFIPQLRDSGLEPPPLEQVADRIEGILEAEKINEALDQWLVDARDNARIEYFDEDVPAEEEDEQSLDLPQTGAKE